MNLQEQISRIQEMMGVIKEELHNTSSADIKTIQSELINMLGNSNTDNGDRVKFVNRVFGSDSSFDIIFDNLDQEILNKINEFMGKKGWFPANIGFSGMKGRIYSQNFKDYLGDDDVQITYEAHSPDEIKITQTKAYHVTPDIFFNKINQEGLIPKSESKLSNHPDRVYLYRNQDKHKDIVWTIWNSLSKERQEQIKNYYVLEIDLTQIPNYNFFKDPQAMADYGAIYTDKPIPKSAIRVIDKIDTKGIETVDKDEMSKEEEKIASNELKQKEKERIDREKEQEKSDSEYAEYSKKVNDLPDNLKNINIDDLLSLEEQIKKVIKKVINESDPKVGTGKKPKGSERRLYTDENPSDTVSVKFKTKQDVIDTLNKDSFKSKSHARQSQIINLIHQRLRVALERAKDPEVKKRLKTAFEYIESKKEESKKKTQEMKEGELTEKCWPGYTQKGMKTMFGKRYPNCVKKTKKKK
jgi:predicted RNA-binding protein with PUA domain